jgi:hypothetical protein
MMSFIPKDCRLIFNKTNQAKVHDGRRRYSNFVMHSYF